MSIKIRFLLVAYSGEVPAEDGKTAPADTFDNSAFASFGNIKGESTNKTHKDWVQIVNG
jgi:hypothetical protein